MARASRVDETPPARRHMNEGIVDTWNRCSPYRLTEDKPMAERSRLFDDFAGVAGGAFSALAGIGEELGALVRARVDEALAALSLVRRDEFEAVSELAANARDAQEAANARLALLESRLAALESKSAVTAEPQPAAAHDHHAAMGAPGGPPPRDDDGSEALPTAG